MLVDVAVSSVNRYLAHRQHLTPASEGADPVRVTCDIIGLHATNAAGPYLSLWARVRDFQRTALEEALYERRKLVRLLCMRTTLHLVPSDQMPYFHQAYIQQRGSIDQWNARQMLVQAGLCTEEESAALLEDFHHQVLKVVAEQGPATVREINTAIPVLQAEVPYDTDKPYGGKFSLGSRLVPGMCALGLLARAQPRGTWRSSLYEYAILTDWLPGLDLQSVTPREARTWLVRRYLSAYGPATFEDVQWWTGFSKSQTQESLRLLGPELAEVSVEGLHGEYLMLEKEAQHVRRFGPVGEPNAFFLPALDPYIMGYKDRRRFLAAEHHGKVFDRAGNAMPTVWVDGRVVGAWVQPRDGRVVYGLFEPVSGDAVRLLESKRRELEGFMDGEQIPLRTHTAFTRSLK